MGPLATRVTSTRLIGRTAELAELEAAFADAADGHPSIAFVAGESGVGKSRLPAELARRARRTAGRARSAASASSWARASCPTRRSSPRCARSRATTTPCSSELGDAARAELATLLPELAPPGARGAASRPDDGAGVAQRRLFEALLSLLERLGRERPVAAAARGHPLGRPLDARVPGLPRPRLCTERVLVVCTYRSDELHRRHPLRPLLAELERDPRARRIELARLTREELAEQLADILGAPPDGRARRAPVRPQRGQPAVHRGAAGRRRRRPRRAAPDAARRADGPHRAAARGRAGACCALLAVAQRGRPRAARRRRAGSAPPSCATALREAAAGHLIVARPRRPATASATRCCARSSHDDLLPGEHAELHLALARALERRAGRPARTRVDHRRRSRTTTARPATSRRR